MADSFERITSGRLLARNAALNLFGYGAPMLVALVAIPLLIGGLGTERFGILTLAWMAVGYFSLFDLGLGRALTQQVAERLGDGREADVPALTWTALVLMLLLGTVGAVLLAVLSPLLVREVFRIPEALQAESRHALYLLAFSLPWVISTTALRGVLEAQQRFGLINALRVPMGVLTYAGPLVVLPFSSSLVPVVAVLVVGRVLAWLAHLFLCLRAVPPLRAHVGVRRAAVAPLLRLGGWMTVSNIISPLMVYLDRFLIGAFATMTAVAYYVAPYEVVTRLWLVPGALLGVLFPAFATSFVRERERTAELFDRGARAILLVLFPVTLAAVTLAADGLDLWLGREFAENSTVVLQWLAVGVFINSLAHVPFAAMQSFGRADTTGRLHLVELPVYILALGWLLPTYGIEGAAIAWAGRVLLDAVVLFILVGRELPATRVGIRRLAAMTGVALLVLGAATVPDDILAKCVFLAVVLTAYGVTAWRWVLRPEERALVRRWLPAVREEATSSA